MTDLQRKMLVRVAIVVIGLAVIIGIGTVISKRTESKDVTETVTETVGKDDYGDEPMDGIEATSSDAHQPGDSQEGYTEYHTDLDGTDKSKDSLKESTGIVVPAESLSEAITIKGTDGTFEGESPSIADGFPAEELKEAEIHNMKYVVEKVVEPAMGENYVKKMDLDQTQLKDLIDISPDTYKDYVAKFPMISTHVDCIIGIEATDGNVEETVKKLTAYKDYLKNEAFNYPMNMANIEAAQIVAYGNSVWFVMLSGYGEEEFISEEESLKNAVVRNQVAIDALNNYYSLEKK